MNKLSTICLTAAMLSAVAVEAAENPQFPGERAQPGSCAEVDWNEDMLRNHPGLVDACREVVLSGDQKWARFEARFVRVEADGRVVFNVQNRSNRSGEEVVIVPAPGQVAYIDGRETPFSELNRRTTISLYVPEGQYGFASEPGAPEDRIAEVVPPRTASADAEAPLAALESTKLPQTAGPLPWLLLGGVCSLLGGLALWMLRRSRWVRD